MNFNKVKINWGMRFIFKKILRTCGLISKTRPSLAFHKQIWIWQQTRSWNCSHAVKTFEECASTTGKLSIFSRNCVGFFFLHVHENVWSQINLDIVNIYESGKDSAGGNQSPKWEWITQYNDSPFGIICFTMWLFGRAHNWRLTDYSTLFFLWQCQLALLPSLSTPPPTPSIFEIATIILLINLPECQIFW